MTGTAEPTAAGLRAVAFFERCLRHAKGRHAGKPFILSPWERRAVLDVFGTLRPDGLRQYRTAFVAVPKKNGKSTLGAGVALYLLTADGERSAEVYGAAAGRDQAKLCFDIAVQMVRASPQLSRLCKIVPSQNRIVVPATNSVYKVLAADAKIHHGYDVSGLIFDELHTQPNRTLWDTLTLGVAARSQPLNWVMTTAGHDRESLCYEQWSYARDVAAGRITDPTFYPLIYEADEDGEWDDPAVWAAANPGLGESVNHDYLEAAAARARRSMPDQNAFRRFHLNQWTRTETRYLDMRRWDAIRDEPPDLDGLPCYGGLDLASTQDLSAFSLAFPLSDGRVAVRCRAWLPEANIREREQRDRAPYRQWAEAGYLTLTPGEATNYDYIRAEIAADADRYDLLEFGVDPWNAHQLANQLANDDGIEVVPVRQGYQSLNAGTKELERLVIVGDLIHANNPLLRRCADATSVTMDPAGNLKPAKNASTERIDPVVATIIAIGRLLANDQGGDVDAADLVSFL